MATRTTRERQFFGRERMLNEIAGGLGALRPISYSVIGSNLIGKSRLLQYLASTEGPLLGDDSISTPMVVAHIDCSGSAVQENLDKEISARLSTQLAAAGGPAFDEYNADSERTTGARMRRVSRQILDSGLRPVLLLDNFDALAGEHSEVGRMVDDLSALMQEMPLVISSKQPLYDLHEQPNPISFVDRLTQFFLGIMESTAALEWTESHCRPYIELTPVAAEIATMTGMHPFLLDRLAYTLSGVQDMLTPGQALGPEHLPLIRMRLSEHGRQLFVTLWQSLQTPPDRVDLRTLMSLLEHLLLSPLAGEDATTVQSPSLNWLINQAIIVYGAEGYQIANPLFAEFLNRRIGTQAAHRVRRVGADRSGSPFLNSLTKTENALLQYFQVNSNSVISPDDLLADVWNRPDASPRRVQEAIRRLRLRLDEAVPPVGVIENERGRGYRFVPAHL